MKNPAFMLMQRLRGKHDALCTLSYIFDRRCFSVQRCCRVGWRTERERESAHAAIPFAEIIFPLESIMIDQSKRQEFSVLAAACVLFAALSACDNSTVAAGSAPPITIGNQIDDTVVAARVRSALMAADDIKSLDIKVTINKGVAMLSGFVDDQGQIARATAVATAVEGVKSIDNQLSLKDGKQTVGNKVDDSVITAQVKSAMLADPSMKSLDVSVTTRKGEVQLSGFVDNDVQASHAVDIAKGVDGVAAVVNHMNLKR
jgi:hyperosmotically inducible protein